VTTASTIRGVQTGINQAFDEEDWSDGDYDESGADSWEKPRPQRPTQKWIWTRIVSSSTTC